MINDFEAEFIAREEIEITNNLNKLSTLALEANIHVVDQGNTYTKELETNKKRKKKTEENTPITWKCNVLPHSRENYRLKGRELLQFSIFMNKLLILMFWLRYSFNKATFIRRQIGGNFSPMPRK